MSFLSKIKQRNILKLYFQYCYIIINNTIFLDVAITSKVCQSLDQVLKTRRPNPPTCTVPNRHHVWHQLFQRRPETVPDPVPLLLSLNASRQWKERSGTWRQNHHAALSTWPTHQVYVIYYITSMGKLRLNFAVNVSLRIVTDIQYLNLFKILSL